MKILIFLTLLSAGIAFGAENSNTTSQNSLFKNKKYEESNTLTDSKLKADDGSLSRYSLKASFGYYGPVVNDLSAPDQPNPDGTVGNYAQALKGSLMTRYRLDSNTAISGGTGISINHPFHGWDRTDVNNPFISYDRSMRLGNTQLRLSPGLTMATVPNYTATGEIGGVTFDQSLVSNINDSRFALSLDTGISWWVYKRAYRPGSIKNGGDGRAQEYSLGLFPGAKYNINDRFSLYGSYALQFYNPRELTHDKFALWSRAPSARLGFSVAFGRKAYFSPYLTTYTKEAFGSGTTINLSTVFSLL